MVPTATYRLQFNSDFRFSEALRLVPYFAQLGISHLYASPIFQARAGSEHGYDVTDPQALNPELGTAEDFAGLVQALHTDHMGLILDIVPNHQAASPENPWWTHALEFGAQSPFAGYFDIDWQSLLTDGESRPKVLLPILGRPYGATLDRHEIELIRHGGDLLVRYYETVLPVSPRSYWLILEPPAGEVPSALRGATWDRIARLASRSRDLGAIERDEASDPTTWLDAAAALKHELASLLSGSSEARGWIDERLDSTNQGTTGVEGGHSLENVVEAQNYRLAYWRVAAERVNYRRFFDISDLVGMRVERPQVFEATHRLIIELLATGAIDGLRVDHVDGLADPTGYLQRLRQRADESMRSRDERGHGYIVVEKILARDETLPRSWPIEGSTGYDFLNAVNALFVDPPGLNELGTIYGRRSGRYAPFVEVAYDEKKRVMAELFPGEIQALGAMLDGIAAHDRYARDLSHEELRQALTEVIACLDVYRTYTASDTIEPEDRVRINRAVSEAERRNPDLSRYAFAFLRRVLLLQVTRGVSDRQRHEWLRFVRRWQQVTGPVMAKGVEDTAFYVYNRLLALNEVGGDPEGPSDPVAEFHQLNQIHQSNWPTTLNATATHDTKRGEDARVRLDLLSEMPRAWDRCLSRWTKWNQPLRKQHGGQLVPDVNEEIFIYQTLIAAWPIDGAEIQTLRDRLHGYLTKALRESKEHTSWLEPNADYERAVLDFVDSILDEADGNRFLRDFQRFQSRLARLGAVNALSQTLLKLTAVGVPDLYRGTELWDLSLADPDNRRPVDFGARIRLLEEISRLAASPSPRAVRDLYNHWPDGRIKLYLIRTALGLRRSHPDLFIDGDYLPLLANGEQADRIVAFARRLGDRWCLIVAPRMIDELDRRQRGLLGAACWGGTRLTLSVDMPSGWINALTGERIIADACTDGGQLPLSRTLQTLPLALLLSDNVDW